MLTPVGAMGAFARAVGSFSFAGLADWALGMGHSGRVSSANNFMRSAVDLHDDVRKAEAAVDAATVAREASMRKFLRWVKAFGWGGSAYFHRDELLAAYREYAALTAEAKLVRREIAKTRQEFKKFFIDSKGGAAMKMLQKAKSQQLLADKKIAEDRTYYRKLRARLRRVTFAV